jgi:CMP-N,N'-diacetyllegionaminic acid synthase
VKPESRPRPSALAIVPARGGSKGIPDKNLVALNGTPLILHTIFAAFAARTIGRTIVSTDSDAIAAVAKGAGAEVPFIRPAELATDSTKTEAVIAHALAMLERVSSPPEIVVVLQPTSPLRNAEDIDGAVELLQSSGAPSVVGICEVDHPMDWVFRKTAGGRLVPVVPHDAVQRRQDAAVAFRLNGALFVVRRDAFGRSGRLRDGRTLGYVMPRDRSIDIDEPLDLAIAEAIIARR